MSGMHCNIHIRKEAYKFSSAHMTVFPDGTKEALHGHNYTTDILFVLKDTSLTEMISFSELKKSIGKICSRWDEKVLIPQNCPFLDMKSQDGKEVHFLLCNKRYILPQDEVVFLPVDNITVENLSREFCHQLINELNQWINSGQIMGLEIRIDESPGQGATFKWKPHPVQS